MCKKQIVNVLLQKHYPIFKVASITAHWLFVGGKVSIFALVKLLLHILPILSVIFVCHFGCHFQWENGG